MPLLNQPSVLSAVPWKPCRRPVTTTTAALLLIVMLLAFHAPPALVSADPDGPRVVEQYTLTEAGGRVDWCAANNTIAFDRLNGPDASDVYTIRPDGTDERCITCSTPDLPAGIRGQPAWHPSCTFLAIQVAGKYNGGSRFESVLWGIHNDLWLIGADGSWAQRLIESESLGAVLHAHFSSGGGRLFWATRESTGRTIPQLPGHATPGEENPWDGWHLVVARLDQTTPGQITLVDRQDIFRGAGGFFESHALRGETIYFSHTPRGYPYVNDVFVARADGSRRVNLTRSPRTWDEHGAPSPNNSLITFTSSGSFGWRYPPDHFDTLRMELWALRRDGRPVQLTTFNRHAAPDERVVASDYAWGPSGDEIAIYYATFGPQGVSQRIDILRLDRRY